MHTQVVRPAGAGHETLYVLAFCALVLLLAGGIVSLRAAPHEAVAVLAHQLDARQDLTAAEQGLFADLRVAAEEIHALRDEAQALPSVADLAEQGLPPFLDDASAQRRGGHAWRLVPAGTHSAYVGQSADVALAGSLLLRVARADAHDRFSDTPHSHPHAPEEADVWLHRDAAATVPEALDDTALTRAGWRQVVTRFDGGVTRHAH